MWLLLLTSCVVPPESRPPCADLRWNEHNHVQPYRMAADVERRRLYSTSLANPNVAEIDLDSGALVAVHPVAGLPLDDAHVTVDDDGIVWLTSRHKPAVIALDPATGEVAQFKEGLVSAHAVVAVAGGGVLVAGATGQGEPVLQRFEVAGPAGDAVVQDGVVRGLFPLSGDRVAALLDELRVLDPASLAMLEQCTLPFEATSGVALSDGTILVGDGQRVGRAGCGTSMVSWPGGTNDKELVSMGDRVAALDRRPLDGLESEGTADPNLGLARFYDADGRVPDSTFPTLKHSGFGAWDPVTGLLWMNSEGTAEVAAFEPSNGGVVLKTRTGTFLDGLAVDGDTAWVTGRLSDTIRRIDDMVSTAEADGAVRWPYSPVVDQSRGLLWVLSQTTSDVHGFFLDDLSAGPTFALGSPPNAGLTFSTLAFDPARDTLWLAQASQDVLVEIDPDHGEVARWPLGGPTIDDLDEIGELSAIVDPRDGSVLLTRSNDGRVVRLDRESGTLQVAWIFEMAADGLGENNRVDVSRLDGEVLTVGHYALDARTLARLPAQDLSLATRLVGRWSGGRVVADMHRHRLLRLDDGASVDFAERDLNAVMFRMDEHGGQVDMTRGAQGFYCAFDIGGL